MYFFTKLSIIILSTCILKTYSFCDVCVTLPLLTTGIQCPICNQDDIDALAAGLHNEETSYDGNSMSNYNNYYNWTTCFLEAKPCNYTYKYRTMDGSCNNLKNPTWGMSPTAFSRILPAYYRDHRHLLALQTNKTPRPLSRVLSAELNSDHGHPDTINLVAMQWGQVIAHDTAFSPPIVPNSIDCCDLKNIQQQDVCLPIMVPKNDVFYSQYGVQCISEIRTNITLTGNNCNNGPAAQIDGATHAIDLSLTYGSDTDTARSLREFKDGKLITQKTKDGRKFLPNVSPDQSGQCFLKTLTEPCYAAGDIRVNQNTELTVLQNLLNREHNRIADKLKELHPEWDDEMLYQESRTITIAEYQHISYKEWLVFYIGDYNMKKFKLYPKRNGYTNYDDNINFMTINGFANSAYRIPHSGIQGHLSMMNYSRVQVNQVPVSDWMVRPKIIQDNNNYDEFLLGFTKQRMEKFGEYHNFQVTNLLFHGFGPYGQDLRSLDIERGRDHGLGRYVDYLQVCTGFKARTFKDLKRYIPKELLLKIQKLYNSVDDIDLFVGSTLERKVNNTRFGPTSLCIILEQFYRKKFGDRFWYEVGGQVHSFTKPQLKQIRKASLSRLICDNSDHINTIARNSFLPISKSNPLVDCKDIPEVNLNKW